MLGLAWWSPAQIVNKFEFVLRQLLLCAYRDLIVHNSDPSTPMAPLLPSCRRWAHVEVTFFCFFLGWAWLRPRSQDRTTGKAFCKLCTCSIELHESALSLTPPLKTNLPLETIAGGNTLDSEAYRGCSNSSIMIKWQFCRGDLVIVPVLFPASCLSKDPHSCVV